MKKSATDLMQEIIFSAVIDSIAAMKAASRGVPNTLLRDLNAVHANTTFADLPPELQAAIGASVRGAFSKLLKEGYSVAPASATPPRPPHIGEQDRRERRPGPARGPGAGAGRGPGGGPGAPGGRGPRRGGTPGGRPGGGAPGGGRGGKG
ncbi:MAG TPA: hypothetical protein VEZ70_08520 [Allosphingosinicella sp.]|nr:hypothetical protein [Allosphingosinicella sp.]